MRLPKNLLNIYVYYNYIQHIIHGQQMLQHNRIAKLKMQRKSEYFIKKSVNLCVVRVVVNRKSANALHTARTMLMQWRHVQLVIFAY